MTDHNPRNCFRVACLTVAALLMALPAAGDAGEDTAKPEGEYSATRKLGRGVASVVYGMLEVPGNMVQEGRVNGPLYGATVGLFLGAGKMVARIPVGVYEVVTAPFQVPSGYEPILEPEFPWQYFRAEEGELYGLRNTYLSKEQHEISEIFDNEHLTDEDKHAVLHGNSERFYGLSIQGF